MRRLHILVRLALMSLLIATGVLVFMYSTSELYDLYQENLPEFVSGEQPRQIAAGVFVASILISFAPLWPKRKRDPDISFTSTHSDVTIELDHAEKTLERVASRLPEVKRISLKLKPSEESGRIRVIANSVLKKDAEGDARLITARVGSYLKTHARKILGQDDVEVKLKVRWAINMRSIKPEPLQLEGPVSAAAVQATPVAAPAPQAAVVEAVVEVETPIVESAAASIATSVDSDADSVETTQYSGEAVEADDIETQVAEESAEDSSAYEALPSLELDEPSTAESEEDDEQDIPVPDPDLSDHGDVELSISEEEKDDEDSNENARGW